MTYDVISTGSRGNAVVINDILIDCGVPFKELRKVYKSIKLVLLTHKHSDHFKASTIKRLSEERPTLRFGCCKWLVKRLVDCGVSPSRIDVLEIGKRYDYKQFAVVPVKLYHDVPNCGYRLYFGRVRAFYATDTRTLEGITAKGYDYYFVEANYITEEMKQRIREKQENGEFAYELRAMNEHLSKEQAENWIYENMTQKGRYIFLHGHIDEA
ncbi:hypothetical protein FMM68_03820 [Lachnospiraceae bacterium MD329]|nr:hypothetical protein [Lachnospiraceae bacterium MD329]